MMLTRLFAALLFVLLPSALTVAQMRPEQMVTKPWVWTVPQYDKTCVTPKVGSPGTFSPTCAFNYITIDAAGETINLPPSPPPGAVGSISLDITYTGSFTPGFQAGAQWQNKTSPVACSGTVTTGCLSSANSTFDRIVGQYDPVRGLVYNVALTNYGVPPAWTLLAHNKGGGATTATTTAINATGADLLVLNATCNGSTFTVTSSPTNTWTSATTGGAVAAGGGNFVQMFYVQAPTVNSSMTASVTCNGASSFATAQLQAWQGSIASPLDQHQSNTTASGTSLSTTSITPVQNNELIVTGWTTAGNAGGVATIGSGFTITDNTTFVSSTNQDGAIAYLIQGTAAAVNPSWGWTTSGGAAAIIASFK